MPGVLLNWVKVRQGPALLASGAEWVSYFLRSVLSSSCSSGPLCLGRRLVMTKIRLIRPFYHMTLRFRV